MCFNKHAFANDDIRFTVGRKHDLGPEETTVRGGGIKVRLSQVKQRYINLVIPPTLRQQHSTQ